MNARTFFSYLAGGCVMALLAVAWQKLADAEVIAPVYFTGPTAVWLAVQQGIENGQLSSAVLSTTYRMLVGWVLASIAGVCLGALIGASQFARSYIQPSLELLRPLPAAAFLPVAIALLGLTEGMILTVIAFGSLWPTLLSTTHGVMNVEPRLREVSAVLGLSRVAMLTRIALPGAMPMILSGMRLSLTLALILSIVGEMLASKPGLGQWILFASRGFKPGDLYAGIVVLCVLGLLASTILSVVESRMTGWAKATR